MAINFKCTPAHLLAATALSLVSFGALAAEGIAPSDLALEVAEDAAVSALVPQAIADAGVLRMAAYGNTPFAMTGDDLNLYGVVVDLGVALAAKMGLEAEIDDLANVAASKVAVESGRYDIGLGPFLDSETAEQDFDIINWIATTPGFIYRAAESYADPMDFCGMRVAIVSGSVPVERNMEALATACEAAGRPAQQVDAFGDQNAMVVGVLSGRSDAAVVSSASALYMAKQQPDSIGAFAAKSDVFGVGLYSGVGIPPAQAELSDAVLAAMTSLFDSGEYGEIFASYGLTDVTVTEIARNPITGRGQ